MAEGASRAILLVCIMLLSGCTFNEEQSNDNLIDNTEGFSFSSKWAEIDNQVIVGELFSTSVLVSSEQSVPWNYELSVSTSMESMSIIVLKGKIIKSQFHLHQR